MMETTIDEIHKQVELLSVQAEFDYSIDSSSKYRDKISQLIKSIDQMLAENGQLNKVIRVRLLFLKGKAYDVLPEYSKQAEESVTKAMKLQPQDPECLVTLGHILWKKKDYQGAQSCFKSAIEQDPKNIRGLQYLSIVLRQLGQGTEHAQYVAQSVDVAKQVLMLDMKNSQSWYLIGNAYVSDYFANSKKNTEQLQLALKAYNQAQSLEYQLNPDLYFNRGNVHCYFEDYAKAFNDYDKAISIDSSLGYEKVKEEHRKITTIIELIEKKCCIQAKKLQNIVKQIPTGLKKQPFTGGKEYKMQPINELKEGTNNGQILACKVLRTFTQSTTIPAGFMIIDSNSAMACLSIYHCSEDIYERILENTDVYVVDPVLKKVQLRIQDQDVSYWSVQILEINKMFVQEQMITSAFSPSVVVNRTFEK